MFQVVSEVLYVKYRSQRKFLSDYSHWQFFIYLHIVGWISQIVSSDETKRKARSFKHTLIVIFFAPYFLVLEVLTQFGYRSREVQDWNREILEDSKKLEKKEKKKTN